MSLLARFYDVKAGEVRVDGTDLQRLRIDSLRSSLGMVLQESFLFSGTIRENIQYGKLDASEDENY